MTELGVVVVVLHQDVVLLTKREDFEIWCLPGGRVDPHESIDQAAVREVREEAGLDITLTRSIGLLSKPYWGPYGTHIAVFAAHPTTVTLNPDSQEVQAAAWFPINHLPTPLLWDHRHLIRAAHAGTAGHVWVNSARTPARFANRAALYAWRDQSGLSRHAAHEQLLQEIGRQTFEPVLGPQADASTTEVSP
jgi:ADP-ribose pyrophosphatase YjhB (NUDIX family)